MRNSFIGYVCDYMRRGDSCGLCYLLDEADAILIGYVSPDCAQLDFMSWDNGINVIICQVDAQGTLLAANNAALDRFDVTRGDVLGTSLFDILPFNISAQSAVTLQRAVATGEPQHRFGFELGCWFYSLYVPRDGPGNSGLYTIIRREIKTKREFVEIRPDGERVKV